MAQSHYSKIDGSTPHLAPKHPTAARFVKRSRRRLSYTRNPTRTGVEHRLQPCREIHDFTYYEALRKSMGLDTHTHLMRAIDTNGDLVMPRKPLGDIDKRRDRFTRMGALIH